MSQGPTTKPEDFGHMTDEQFAHYLNVHAIAMGVAPGSVLESLVAGAIRRLRRAGGGPTTTERARPEAL